MYLENDPWANLVCLVLETLTPVALGGMPPALGTHLSVLDAVVVSLPVRNVSSLCCFSVN